jgi:hypothetical protein
MTGILDSSEQHSLLIDGLRGHLVALDHALRLLIAASPDGANFQCAWKVISAELEADSIDPRHSNSTIYRLALKQCADRIMSQFEQSGLPKQSSH